MQRELEYTVGLDRAIVFDFTVGKVHSLPLKVEVYGCGIFGSSSALGRGIHYSHGYKVEPAEIKRNGVETIVKFCLQKSLISSLFCCYTLRE